MKTCNRTSHSCSRAYDRVGVRWTNRRSMLLTILFAVLALSPLSYSQTQQASLDSTIAVVRADTQADRVTIITGAMKFNEKDSSVFWPIYRNYQYERSKLDDKRVAVIKDYAAKYQSMTDADAKGMAQEMFDCDAQLAALKKRYYKKFNTVLPALMVTKFFQLEHRIDLLMDMKVESSLPPIGQPLFVDQPQQTEEE